MNTKKGFQKVRNYSGKKIQVINFEALAKEPFSLGVILTGRTLVGKTTNALQFIRTSYLNNKHLSTGITTTSTMVKPDMLDTVKLIYPKEGNKVKQTNKGLFDETKKEYFCYFYSIKASDKSKMHPRNPKMKFIGIDEPDANTQTLKKGTYTSSFFQIVLSVFNITDLSNLKDNKIFILQNNTTLDTELLIDLGVKSSPKTDYEIRNLDSKNQMIIFAPKKSKEEIKEIKEQNNGLISLLGTVNKMGFVDNVSMLYDNLLAVVPPEDQGQYKTNTLNQYIKVASNLYLKVGTPKNIFFFELKRNNTGASQTITLKSKGNDVGITRNQNAVEKIYIALENNNLLFDSIVSKNLLLENL